MTLSRRDALRGFSLGAGSLVLAPILSQLQAQAAGIQRLPRRFVFVLQCNGFQPQAARPRGIEATRTGPDRVIDLPLERYELPADLEPLTPFQKRVTILQRLNGAHSHPYHAGGFASLSGSREAKKQPLAESIDAALARVFPGVFPLANLGVDLSTPNRTTAYVCSAWGPGKPIATICRPDLAYQTLFGSVAAGSARQDFDARGKLLDFMKDDVRQVSQRLAGEEREKFDYYLHAFESMSERMARLRHIEPALRRHAPNPDARYASDTETQRLEAQFELAAAALISGLTNVATLFCGVGGPSGQYTGLGIGINVHQMGHGGTDQGRSAQELATLVRQFHMRQIASLVQKLSAVPEGDGTMMDNTVILYTSDAGHGHHSDGSEWPFVLIGDLGKRLRSGRYLEYPGYRKPGNRTHNALYCTLLHAAGAPRDHFNLEGGIKDVDRPGPLAELLA